MQFLLDEFLEEILEKGARSLFCYFGGDEEIMDSIEWGYCSELTPDEWREEERRREEDERRADEEEAEYERWKLEEDHYIEQMQRRDLEARLNLEEGVLGDGSGYT